MKQILAIGILSLLLTNCMSTKRYSTFVNTKIQNSRVKNEPSKDWLIIKSDRTEPARSKYDQKKNSFIPAILYWGWNSTIECELDIETRIQYLRQGIYKAADSLGLNKFLSGSHLEINLKEVPGKFLYENRGDAIIFIIAYAISVVESISPYPIDLKFEYEVNKEGDLIMSGEGYIQNGEQPLGNMWSSTKKFTWRYLDEFKKETGRMGTELVLGIIEELKEDY